MEEEPGLRAGVVSLTARPSFKGFSQVFASSTRRRNIFLCSRRTHVVILFGQYGAGIDGAQTSPDRVRTRLMQISFIRQFIVAKAAAFSTGFGTAGRFATVVALRRDS